jgi:hexosaminidase
MKPFNFLNCKSLFFIGVLFTISLMQACDSEPPTDLAKADMIPKPVSVVSTGKGFSLLANSIIYVEGESRELTEVANYLAAALSNVTGFTNKVESISGTPDNGNFYLVAAGADEQLGTEGYELIITNELVTIKANKPEGVFRGVQTLMQIIPVPKEKSENPQTNTWRLATGTMRDYPLYAWRGSMLDVGRHFFNVEDVKRYIDLISYYKMNMLHLGLTNDQGWRIEIKSWPNLALHGGSTQVGGGKGGYYTQEQYKDIVAYAASRYITIVPEIDLPGHINAALASYGELNGGIIVPEEGRYKGPLSTQGILDGKTKPTELYTGIGVGWSTLRLEKPATFKFVNDVLRELAAITPGPYLHIGGDEAHVTKKEDYIEFVNRFSEIVKANGKQMIGWEEIAQGNIDENTISQHWDKPKYAQMAAEKGAKIIMSPSKRVYLDMQYDSTTKLGLHWAAYIEVDDAYNWDPATQVEGVDRNQIMGVEAPLWTETIATMDDIEYMLFPRLPGIAEIGWSPAEGRSWEEYKIRLANHGPWMKAKGIDFYRSARVDWRE